ncbi:hypothetical protein GWO56_05930 [Corynebacterium macginleyi]|uniref:hypothetical protein n=1 Tax=Corynebacterium macginleyi TaxID=38290 RepID=UPI00190A8E66|nr:hypothetical protein [Corynebacterium macginleyi]MBK4159094.1 hypothetical protein [Corynebacterium macginleyi]
MSPAQEGISLSENALGDGTAYGLAEYLDRIGNNRLGGSTNTTEPDERGGHVAHGAWWARSVMQRRTAARTANARSIGRICDLCNRDVPPLF